MTKNMASDGLMELTPKTFESHLNELSHALVNVPFDHCPIVISANCCLTDCCSIGRRRE